MGEGNIPKMNPVSFREALLSWQARMEWDQSQAPTTPGPSGMERQFRFPSQTEQARGDSQPRQGAALPPLPPPFVPRNFPAGASTRQTAVQEYLMDQMQHPQQQQPASPSSSSQGAEVACESPTSSGASTSTSTDFRQDFGEMMRRLDQFTMGQARAQPAQQQQKPQTPEPAGASALPMHFSPPGLTRPYHPSTTSDASTTSSGEPGNPRWAYQCTWRNQEPQPGTSSSASSLLGAPLVQEWTPWKYPPPSQASSLHPSQTQSERSYASALSRYQSPTMEEARAALPPPTPTPPFQPEWANATNFMGPPQPRLNLIPERLINFSKYHIRFTIQAYNLPRDMPLSSFKIEGAVETPKGRILQCSIRQIVKTNKFEVDSFTGTFKSTEEVGLYQLKVRLFLPISMSWNSGDRAGVIGDQMSILISRNYYRESLIENPTSFQVEYVPWEPGHTNGGAEGRDESAFLPSKAWGITCDKATNRLYYTDRIGHILSCLDPNGQVIFKYPRTSTDESLHRPTGICCDEVHRRLIIADKDNHRISFFSLDGEYISSFGKPGHANGAFNYPWDVAVSPRGDKIAVADSRNKRLQLFDRNGNYLDKFSVYETTPFDYKNNFDYPRGVTFDREGQLLYVTDFNANNIIEVPLTFEKYRKLLPDGKLKRPQGIAVDSMDCILVCDSKNKAVRHIYPPDGQVLSQIHAVGMEKLEFPVNVALMADGKVAVLDAQARVRIF